MTTPALRLRLLPAAALAAALAACTEAPAPAALRSDAAIALPADGEFFPFRCAGANAGDVLGDPVTGNGERDIVGDATFPAFYRAADATHVFFRMRVSLDPRKPAGTSLQPSSWDVLVDTDGNLSTYEYMLTADGNIAGTSVQWVRNSVQDPADPRDPAKDVPADLLQNFTPASDYWSVKATGDGSTFGGDPDWFITLALPKATLSAAGIDLTRPFVVWGGTNAQNYSLNADFGCFLNIPTGLAAAATEPAYLDPAGFPDAIPDTAVTAEDTAISTAVLANDIGLRDAPIALVVSSPPAHGAATPGAGTVVYTPAPDWSGTDAYTYRITDADGQTDTATVTVTVAPADDGAPAASADSATVAEDGSTTVDVLANDASLVDAPVTVGIASPPAHGTAVANADGTVTYVPAADFAGEDAFAYRVTDVDGQGSTASVSVTVTPADDGPPVALADAAATSEDAVALVPVLANDAVVDGPATVAVVAPPAHGAATVNADGTVTYAPDANWNGTDAFTYRVLDRDGEGAIASVSVAVSAVDDGAPAAAADGAATLEDVATTIAVLANDTVVDGPATVTVVAAPAHGTAAANGDGTITYTPAADYAGPDAFTYEVADRDGQTATAAVSVATAPSSDGPPVAAGDAPSTSEDTATTIAVLANDTVLDGPATVTVVAAPAHGTATANGDGTITYTPAADYFGSDAFTYRVTDLDGQTAAAAVTVAVMPVSDGAPSASDDAPSAAEDGPETIAVLANDTVLDGPATVTVVAAPAHGTATANGDGTITYAPDPDWNGADAFTYAIADRDGEVSSATVTVIVAPADDGPPAAAPDLATAARDTALVVDVLANDVVVDGPATVGVVVAPTHGAAIANADGTVTYTPTAGYLGADTFAYEVADRDGQTATAAVSVNVEGDPSGPPEARADVVTTAEDAFAVVDVLANDTVLDPPATVSIATPPAHGTAVANGDGTVTYTPDANWSGTDAFSYDLRDRDGESSMAAVTVSVAPVSDGAPVVVADDVSTPEDSPLAVSVLSNDGVLDGPGSVVVVAQPAHGTATVNEDGTVAYAPDADWNGTDAFTYRVVDWDGEDATATVTVTVGALDDGPPAAAPDESGTAEDAATTIAVLANDTVPDAPPALAIATPPAHGTAVAAGGAVTYTPTPDWNGEDAFTYSVTDADGQASTGAVTVSVAPVNDAPVALPDAAAAAAGTGPIDVAVLANDSDVDGDALAVASVTQGAHGTVTVEADGIVRYVTAAGFTGADAFTYTVSDGAGATATAAVEITVNAPADSDGDGLEDAAEIAAGTDPADADSDDDGVADGAEPGWNADTDGDGLVNARDPDADDDGLFDGTELGITEPGPDTDVAGGVFVPDADPATRTDPLLADTDGDGASDGAEDANHDGAAGPGESDGTLADTDDDGLGDAEERAAGLDPADGDTDDDGVADGDEANWSADTDRDGLVNARDPDSDGDGILDGTETGVTVPGPDTDVGEGHFVPDDDPATTTHPLLPDSDGDGTGDGAEDVDHDGAVDAGELDPANADTDGDGFADGVGVRGGGCSTGGSGLAPAVAVALVALLRRWRR